MGLLMATFEMAQEYKSDGISINALMIPPTKMSKNTVKKFKGYWKIFAVLQNPFIPKAEVIGNAYFSICTNDAFRGITGKLINHKGQIVPVADKSLSFAKIITGSNAYPPYADDKKTSKRVWEICSSYAIKK